MGAARSISLEDLSLDVALSGVTRGDLFFRGASQWNNLPAGVDGRVLTTHGAGADPTWEAGGGGADPTRVAKAGDTMTGRLLLTPPGSATDDATSAALVAKRPSGSLTYWRGIQVYRNDIDFFPMFEVGPLGQVGAGGQYAASYPLQAVNSAGGTGIRVQTLASTPTGPSHDWIMGSVEMVIASQDNASQAGLFIGTYSNHPIFFGPNLTKRLSVLGNGEVRIAMANAVPDLNASGLVAPNSSGVFYVDQATGHVLIKLKISDGSIKTLDLGAYA
jgi:hypothetical protein